MYEIQIGIGYNWEHMGADDDAPCYYTTRKEAEEELYDMWREMDVQQMEYTMDDYQICEVKPNE